MKLETKDINYAATIVRVVKTQSLNGLDRLIGLPVFGYQAIISRETPSETLGVLFTAETQLSEELCAANNLYRHREKNSDTEKSGYLEDSRRVKAIKLKGNVSSALWLDMSALDYLGIDTTKLKEGDTFTHIDGAEICRKYRLRHESTGGNNRKQENARVINKLFPKHFDTENWFKNSHLFHDNEIVYVTQKLHGTSARFANQMVVRKLSLVEKIAKFFGAKVQETEYVYLVGTRNTVRDPDAPAAFYEHDIWIEWLNKIKHLIPKNWVIYGEIIGYAGNKLIQSNYSYRHGPGQSSFFVYRVAVVNSDGLAIDLGWDTLRAWCNSVGLSIVPELMCGRRIMVAEKIRALMDLDYSKSFNCIAIGDDSPCDEGVCIRADRLTPLVLKAKSPLFLQMETRAIDAGAVDTEEVEALAE